MGYELIAESKRVAEDWGKTYINILFDLQFFMSFHSKILKFPGISDLYVHVAVNNEAAKNLYIKSGFTMESDEPAWQARFLDRPRRLLLWTALPISYQL